MPFTCGSQRDADPFEAPSAKTHHLYFSHDRLFTQDSRVRHVLASVQHVWTDAVNIIPGFDTGNNFIGGML